MVRIPALQTSQAITLLIFLGSTVFAITMARELVLLTGGTGFLEHAILIDL